MATTHDDVAALADDMRRTIGRPCITLAEAAGLTACSISTLRGALHRGELLGSRRARNGPVTLTTHDLATWVVGGRRRALPDLAPEAREERRERLEAARRARLDR